MVHLRSSNLPKRFASWLSSRKTMRKGKDRRSGDDDHHQNGQIWLRDLPIRKWIARFRDSEPTPLTVWAYDKPTKSMVNAVPARIARIGIERIPILCRVRNSADVARIKLILKGRRVKYGRQGIPDSKVNYLRRFEEGGSELLRQDYFLQFLLSDETVRAAIMKRQRKNRTISQRAWSDFMFSIYPSDYPGEIMNEKSVGLLELSSIAAGFQIADIMLKASNVRILLSRSICSGKYMVLVGGEMAAVEAATAAGEAVANGCLIDSLKVANLHPDVITAIGRTRPSQPEGALGILESFNVATMIKAADAAVKAANVELLELRLAMALGGKAFCTMTGDVASVQAAVAAGRAIIAEAGILVNAVVIPRPHPDVYREVV